MKHNNRGITGSILIYIVVSVMVVGVLAAGGYYYMQQTGKNSPVSPTYDASPTETPITSTEPEDLSRDLESINVGDIDVEFEEVDSDINSL